MDKNTCVWEEGEGERIRNRYVIIRTRSKVRGGKGVGGWREWEGIKKSIKE